jgi:hypothetical protein
MAVQSIQRDLKKLRADTDTVKELNDQTSRSAGEGHIKFDAAPAYETHIKKLIDLAPIRRQD